MARRERVAFLGLGIMGAPMAANLIRAGFEVTVWNRTAPRANEFAAKHGGSAADTAALAAESADIAITMVVDAPDVEAVLFGASGAAEGLHEGCLVVDMSTIAPSASVGIAERLREQGIAFLDAPVTGSRPRAEDGTLTIMVGGADADFERARPVLEGMGELIVHVGPQGHGSMVKLINNTVAAVNAATLAEGLLLAKAADLDTDRLRQVMAAGSGSSAMLTLKAEAMLDQDFDPLFKLAHMLKDVRHCLEEARRLGVSMPLATTAELLYTQADRHGMGEHDFAAVITALEESET